LLHHDETVTIEGKSYRMRTKSTNHNNGLKCCRPVEKSAGRFHVSVAFAHAILFPISKFEIRSSRR